MKKPSAEDQKVADAMMGELEALMKPGTVYVSFIVICNLHNYFVLCELTALVVIFIQCN